MKTLEEVFDEVHAQTHARLKKLSKAKRAKSYEGKVLAQLSRIWYLEKENKSLDAQVRGWRIRFIYTLAGVVLGSNVLFLFGCAIVNYHLVQP